MTSPLLEGRKLSRTPAKKPPSISTQPVPVTSCPQERCGFCGSRTRQERRTGLPPSVSFLSAAAEKRWSEVCKKMVRSAASCLRHSTRSAGKAPLNGMPFSVNPSLSGISCIWSRFLRRIVRAGKSGVGAGASLDSNQRRRPFPAQKATRLAAAVGTQPEATSDEECPGTGNCCWFGMFRRSMPLPGFGKHWASGASHAKSTSGRAGESSHIR